MAASWRALEVARCAQGENLGDLNLAIRSLVGLSEAVGTMPLYEQSAAWRMVSPRLSLKGSWLRLAKSPYIARGC